MKILIMTGGRTDKGFALGFLQKEAFDICIVADSALEMWDKVEEKLPDSYKIDHLVGDFDSVSPEILDKYINREDITVHRFQPEKDYTDTDIAVRLAIRLCKESGEKDSFVTLLGATGTRLDHTLANMQLLVMLQKEGIGGCILDEHNRIRLLEGDITVHREQAFGNYFSLIPVTPVLRRVSIEGAKYPLSRHDVFLGESICVSNEYASDTVQIHVEEGTAFLIESRD